MYKIFINEKPFIISDRDVTEGRFADCTRVTYDPASMLAHIKDCEGMKSKGTVMICPDAELAFKDFYTHFVAIEAAGGVVFNHLGEILLIKRLGKWDMPKGKIDGDESVEEAAIREVMEECGIDGLSIKARLNDSYHTYKMHNHRFLKITHWFTMDTSSEKIPKPQEEENITEARWFDWKTLDPAKLDTYFSIRELLYAVQ